MNFKKLLLATLCAGLSSSVLAADYDLKFGTQFGTASVQYKAMKVFAEELAKGSKGKIDVTIIADGQLGDDRSMLQQLSQGALDFTTAESGRFNLFYPEAEVYSLPYMFKDFSALQKAVFDTEFGKSLIEKIKNDLKIDVLADAYSGTRETTSNRAINSIDDMKGLKLRIPGAEPNKAYAQYSGAAPTPMPFNEVYLALQTNNVDGQENPLPTINDKKFYEVQKYLAMTNHIVNDNLFLASEMTMQNLPADLQEAVVKAAKAAADYQTKTIEEQEKSLIEAFKLKGVTVTYPDLKPFRAAMKPYYDQYIEKTGKVGEDAIKEFEELN